MVVEKDIYKETLPTICVKSRISVLIKYLIYVQKLKYLIHVQNMFPTYIYAGKGSY